MNYELIKQMYRVEWVDDAYVDRAVALGVITAAQATEIKGGV